MKNQLRFLTLSADQRGKEPKSKGKKICVPPWEIIDFEQPEQRYSNNDEGTTSCRRFANVYQKKQRPALGESGLASNASVSRRPRFDLNTIPANEVPEKIFIDLVSDSDKENEVDEDVKRAAEILVQMKYGSKERVYHRSQSSIDSYEAMVLNLKECDPANYLTYHLSTAYNVDISQTKASKYQLKRGTRLRNFQKDILPDLTVLSREDIREDVETFEVSPKYIEMRAKMSAEGQGWFDPRKRSKLVRRS